MPVILATQEAEIRRIKFLSRPGLEKKNHKNRVGGMAQRIGSDFKPQYHKKKKGKFIIHTN
jgi:hypothetical protein